MSFPLCRSILGGIPIPIGNQFLLRYYRLLAIGAFFLSTSKKGSLSYRPEVGLTPKMSDDANTSTSSPALSSLRTNLIGWILFPLVGVVVCLVLHLLLLVRANISLVTWLVWSFPLYDTLASFSRSCFRINFAAWIILYGQSLWLGAIYFYVCKSKSRTIISGIISGIFIVPSLLYVLLNAL